jgi:signal transduction histidine kinase
VTFRQRLLLTSLTTLAVGLAALLVAGNVVLAVRVHDERSTLLRERAQAQIAALEVTPTSVAVRETANDAVLDRQSWVIHGTRVVERPASAPDALDRAAVALGRAGRPAERDGPDDVRLRAEPVHAPGTRTPVGVVVVALSAEPLERLQQQVLFGSLVIAGFVLLAGLLAIRGALSGALRPVAQMTASAQDWSEHDLDRRFDLGPVRDELTGLAATLDGLLARIAASRRHEQRFASEVAHELRTPVAGLRGRAELALGASGPEADAERAAALRAVVGDAERIDAAVDMLLAIARREFDPAAGSVDLAELARELEGIEVSAPTGLPAAEGEPELVRRALAPLVDNARRHARGRVRIELSAAGGRVQLAVRDDGPGLHAELGERAFEPGVRGLDEPDGGAGLGLALARRLARSCGGDVVAGPGPGGCFVLELPAVGSGT